LSDYKFNRLKDDGEVPAVRNGHTLNYFSDRLYVFGGIHDITWELDDLHIYDLKVIVKQYRQINGPLLSKTLPEKLIEKLSSKTNLMRKNTKEKPAKRKALLKLIVQVSGKKIPLLQAEIFQSPTMKMVTETELIVQERCLTSREERCSIRRKLKCSRALRSPNLRRKN